MKRNLNLSLLTALIASSVLKHSDKEMAQDGEKLLDRTTIGGGRKRFAQAQLAAAKVDPKYHHISRQVKRAAQRKHLKAMSKGLLG